MPASVQQIIEQASKSGLLAREDGAAVVESLPEAKRGDPQEVAKALIRAGKLTKYQAAVLYSGKGSSLAFGEYVILDKLGQGGMGIVLRARHRRMDREVAIKVLPAAMVNSPDAQQRFYREVKTAARLIHPNIVTAFDASEHGKMHYLVMEFVDGRDLAKMLEESGTFTVRLAVDCIAQAARGLQFAHERGVIHRDIKPANLLLDKHGQIKILDMGLARFDAGDDALTRSGQVMGTVDYMAPEQATDTHTAGAPADIYSLGCTLWRVLAGTPVYEAETLMNKMLAHLNQPIPSLSAKRSDVPEELDELFRAMVAKSPNDRPSVKAVIAQLEQIAVPDSKPTPVKTGTSAGNDALTEFLQNAGKSAATSATKPAREQQTVNIEVHSATGTKLPRLPTDSKVTAAKKSRTKLIVAIASALTACVLLAAGVVVWRRGNGPGKPIDKVANHPASESPGDKKTPDPPQSIQFPLKPAKWEAAGVEKTLDGIIHRPATLPGVKRWQAIWTAASTSNYMFTATWDREGKYFAVADMRVVKVYQEQDGKLHLVRVLPTDAGFCWGPEPGSIVTWTRAGSDSELTTFEVSTGKKSRSLQLGVLQQSSSLFGSPDGSQVIARTLELQRISLRESKVVARWEMPSYLRSVAWSPKGEELALLNEEGLSICDWQGKELRKFAVEKSSIGVAWSSDGTTLSVGSQLDGVALLDAMTGSSRLIEKTGSVRHQSWTDDNRLVFGSEGVGIIADGKLIDTKFPLWWPNNGHIACGRPGTKEIYSLRGATSTGWRLRDEHWEVVLPPASMVTSVAIGGERNRLALTSITGDTWAQGNDGLLIRLHPGQTSDPTLSRNSFLAWTKPDSLFSLTLNNAEMFYSWDFGVCAKPTQHEFASILFAGIRAFVSPDGRWGAFSDNDGRINVVDFRARLKAKAWTGATPNIGLTRNCWSSLSDRIAAVNADGKLQAWSVPAGELICEIKVDAAPPRDFAWSRDGKQLAVIDNLGAVRLYDSANGAVAGSVQVSLDPHLVEFGSDGALLCRSVTEIACLELDPPRERWKLSAMAWYTFIASSDGSIVLTGEQLHDAVTGNALRAEVPAIVDPYAPFSMSPDNKRLACKKYFWAQVCDVDNAENDLFVVPLPTGKSAVFDRAGNLRVGETADLDGHIAYYLEMDDGQWQLLTPTEFAKRFPD